MRFDWSAKNFELDESVGVDTQDSCHSWVGVVAADDDVSASDRHEARMCIRQTCPQPPVDGHVHEVNSEVVLRGVHSARLRLIGEPSSGVTAVGFGVWGCRRWGVTGWGSST
jgi:hypothetical protein